MSLGADPLSRRGLLGRAAWLAGASLLPAGGRALARPKLGSYPFSLGVASGEPAPDGMVLWTRLAPRPFDPAGGMPPEPVRVRWTVAEDAGLTRVVRQGAVAAEPQAGHSVHVEVAGLRPDRPYWYRFEADGEVSPVGRTRTTPAPGAEVERLRFAFSSCQKFEAGYFGAYTHMVEDAPDLILFLGDYIYEGDPGSRDAVRLHPNPEPKDVGGYRVRYAAYKADPMLQAAHAAAPWMVIWDDHEVENDYRGDRDQDDGDPVAFLQRRAAAYQVYYEHMPLRRRSLPVGPAMQLYRSLDWGRLAQFQFVDDRQYRGFRPCRPPGSGRGKLVPDCEERRDPRRSLLGAAQEAWLLDTLANSRARWNLLAQQTLFGELAVRDPEAPQTVAYSSDGWDGAPASRTRILQRWREAKVSNPVALGGDVHAFAAGELRETPAGPAIGTEFVGGSISSFGPDAASAARVKAMNPHLRHFDGALRGYARVDVTPTRSTTTFRGLDATVPQTPVADLASFVVESGRPGLT
jgi:alkaline phosphatase D